VSLPGGPADKLGNRYELWWTVVQIQNLLLGQWDSIRIEVPGIDKVEFELIRGNVRSYHQVKRSAATGKWTLAELASPDIGILQSIEIQLKTPESQYVFVSSSDARELAELSERARDSASLKEFVEFFTNGKEQQQRLARLRKSWSNCDDETARDLLRRIEVRVLDERSLREQALLQARALFLVPPANVCSVICNLLVDSIHQTLTRAAVIEHLAKAGYALRQIVSLDQAKFVVERATKTYLSGTRSRLIRGSLVPREVTDQLLANLATAGSDCVLTGRAGTGKTGCIVEFVQKLQSDHIPVLAFRLDRVDPVASTTELGQKLGLEESPALVLAAAAENQPSAVLIVDQLDAISTSSGRTTGFFDTVEALLDEARGLRSQLAMHILVVCREFDWKNDHRLRKLLARGHNHVLIGDFAREQVLTILGEAGYETDSMTPRTIELLRLPQNLSLFLDASFPSQLPLNTTAQLYEHYWECKRRLVNERAAPTQDNWHAAIRTLVDGMTESQQLSIRREILDQTPPEYVNQMISEGVITLSGNRVGFGHESFFDYCFARQFVISAQSLVEFLLLHEQHLFRRAQVRQVLQFLHEDEAVRFCKELEALVRHPQIRTHLKDLALAVAANSPSISVVEWELWFRLVTPYLEGIRNGSAPDALSTLAWKHFFASGLLFEQTHARGIAKAWLESEHNAIIDLGLSYLRMHDARFSSEIAELLRPFKGNEAWRQRLVWFMQLTDLNGSREMFDLFLALLEDGTLDDARGVIAVNSTFWNIVYGVAGQNPQRMCEIVATWLRRQLHLAQQTAQENRYVSFKGERFADDPISRAAQSAPEHYVECVLPVIVAISSRAAVRDHEPPLRDSVWPYLMVPSHGLDAGDAALFYLQQAMESVSSTYPESLRDHVDLLKQEETYVANVLLMHAYAGNGRHFGHEAVELLTAQPWRFECGVTNNSHWYAQRAVKSISMDCAAEDLAQLESTILRYVPPFEKTKSGYKYHGQTRFNLLAAIPVERRSPRVSVAFRELERKFGEPNGEPEGARGGWVGPPISDDRLGKMDDKAILAAIAHYSASKRPPNYRDFLRGGNDQLISAIGAMAAKEPYRFAQLALRLPGSVSPGYFRAILRALEKASIEDVLKLQVASKVFAELREHCGQELADLLGAIEDQLPDESLEQLSWLALQCADPTEEASRTHESDPFSHGLNSIRGRAVLAIGNLINRDPQYVGRFEDTLQKMADEKSTSVLTCIAFTLRALAVRDFEHAMSLFERCCLHAPAVRYSEYGSDLIRVGIRSHFGRVRSHIQKLLQSPDEHGIEKGALLVCIAALMHPEAVETARSIVNGDEKQRLIAARVASANIGVEEFRLWCEKQLLHFFNDSDKKVRAEAGQCFRHLEGDKLEDFANLIEAYCHSAAFEDNSHSLLYTLEGSVEKLPGVVCTVCELFLMRFGFEARDIRTSRAADGFNVSKLIFRVYHQHQREEWGSRSLDVIDRLCQEGVGEVMTELQDFDR